MPNGVTNSYVYDAFERLTSKTAYRHSVSYTYVSGSALVASETVSRYDGGVTNYAYTYNALGYITAISKNGTTVAEYEYDALGQLVCEEYPVDNVAYVYSYDKAGNITGKNKFPYNANAGQKEYTLYLASQKETVATYGYSSSSWGDMLTNYNGTSITYDAIGNPSNWRNAISMSWDKRGLSSLTFAQNETLSFTLPTYKGYPEK